MQQWSRPRLTSLSELKEQTRLLASIEATEVGFVSCYLDAQLGLEGGISRIDRQAEGLRSTLAGTDLLDFEDGLTLVKQAVRQTWHPQAKGVAIFARGAAGGRLVTAMRFALPVANRLTFYRVPEIGPLMSLQQTAPNVGLVLARRGALQVFDLDMGSACLRAWVAGPDGTATETPLDTRGKARKPEANRIRLFRRVLSAGGAGPLVVAGDKALLAPIRAWLPQRAAARLADVIAVPYGFGQADAIDFVRRRASAFSGVSSGDASVRWLRAMRSGGGAVAGYGATLEALRTGSAQSLVMTPDYRPQRGWLCERCGVTAFAAEPPGDCTACAGAAQRVWDPRIELTRLAAQRGVPLLVTDSDELRYLGGVGCLMAKPAEAATLPRPARRWPRYRGLGQVA